MTSTKSPRRRGDRDQSGFVLMTAMSIIVLLAGVTLIALTSMTLTSSRISETQQLSTREVRAADNALESAINLIRMDPNAELGDAEDCLGSAPIDLSTNGRDVTVTATCEESERAMPVRDSALGAAPAVQLVGADGYRSVDTPDDVQWATDCLRPVAKSTDCFPWAYGMGPANYDAAGAAALGAAAPSLVHSGGVRSADSDLNHTLHFASNVTARRGAAAAVDPTTDGPAMNVTGRYTQGDVGLLGDSSLPCGLSTDGHVWNVLAARIVDADDGDGRPECQNADAGALGDRTEILPRPGLGEQFGSFATVPACSGAVVEFQPGAYGKAQTQAINDLLDGSCPNKVFWFRPSSATVAGNYWFDVDDTTNADRNLWNSLIIADPTAKVIFGTPKGGLSAAAAQSATFPDACDAEAAGVEAILSPRTSLRHLAGKVAICDRDGTLSTTNVPAALWQAGSVNSGWQGYANPSSSDVVQVRRTSGISWSWGSSGADNKPSSWFPDGNSSRSWAECKAVGIATTCDFDTVVQARGIGLVDQAGQPRTAPAPGRVESLMVIMKAQVDDDDGFNLYKEDSSFGTTVTFTRAGAASPTCAVYFPYKQKRMGAAQPLTLAFDLKSAKGQAIDGMAHCKDVNDLSRTDLHGSSVDVQIRQRRNIPIDIGIGTYRADVYVDSVELRAGWDLQPTAANGGSGWQNAANLVPASPFASSSDHLHGGYTLSGCPFLGSCQTATREVTLSGFDNTVHPFTPTSGSLQAAGLIVTGETTTSSWFANNSFYDRGGAPDISDDSNFTAYISGLRDAPSASCSINWTKVPFWGQSIYLDLLESRAGNTCAGVITSAEQLIGAQVRLSVYVERNSWGANVNYGSRIDGVQLSTVTSGDYTHPRVPNVITIGDGPGDDSSFSIYGQVSTPRNDLNIRWNGPSPRSAEGDPIPVGGGNMILNGLGSYVGPDGEAGVVCCSPTKPAERIVTLTATVDRGNGNQREAGAATIVVSDTAGPGGGLAVVDWRIG